MSDYADKIADVIATKWEYDDSDDRDIRQLVAAGVREGYRLASGVKS